MLKANELIEAAEKVVCLSEAWNCPIGPNVKIGKQLQKVVRCVLLHHRDGYDRMAAFSHNIQIAGSGKPKEYYYNSKDGTLYWYKNHSRMPKVDFVDLGGKDEIPPLKDILKPAFLKRMGGSRDSYWALINYGVGLNDQFKPKNLADRLKKLRTDIVLQLAHETGISTGEPWDELGKFVDDIPDAKLIKFTKGKLVVKDEDLDEGYHAGTGKFNSGHDGARLYSRSGSRFRIVSKEGRHWKVPVRGRLRSQMSKAEQRKLALRDDRRKGLEKKTKLPEGYNSAADELDAAANPVERLDFYAQVIESVGGQVDEGLPMAIATASAMTRALAKTGRQPAYTPDISAVERECKADHREIYGALVKTLNPPSESVVSKTWWHPGELDVKVAPHGTVLKYRLGMDGVWTVEVISARGQLVKQPVGNHRSNGKKIVKKTLKILKKMRIVEEVNMRRNLKIGPHGMLEDPTGMKAFWYEGAGHRTGEIVDAFVHPRLSMSFVRIDVGTGRQLDMPAYVIQVEDDEDDSAETEFDFPAEPGIPGPYDVLQERVDALFESLAVPAEMLGLPSPVEMKSVSVDDEGVRTWVTVEGAAITVMVNARREGIKKMRVVKSEFDKLLKPFGIRSANINYDVQLDFGEVEYVLKDPAATVCVVWDSEGRYFNLKSGWWLEIKGLVKGGAIVVKKQIGKLDAKPKDLARAATKSIQKLAG